MKHFAIYFIVLDENNELGYAVHRLSGYRYPEHTPKGIVEMCNIMNSVTSGELRYVDMFRVIDADGSIVWTDNIYAEKEHVSLRPVLETSP